MPSAPATAPAVSSPASDPAFAPPPADAALQRGRAAPAAAVRRPRVLQVITKLDLGGAEAVCIDLVGALRESTDFGVFGVFDLAAPSQVGRDMAARLADWGVPFSAGTAGHFKKGGVLVAAWRLARAIARFRPDVVHLHTEVPELTFAVTTLLSPRARRVPVLRTVHNCELWIEWDGIGRWVTGRLARAAAIAVSGAAADADAAIPTRQRRPRAQVVPNGVVAPPLAPPRGGGPFRILFAGRLVRQKAPDLLPAILAAAHARTTRRDVAVTIAGEGPLAQGLEASLGGVAPGWDIALVPPIERLPSHLGEYDCVLMPSRFEGLGLLAIEALLAGVPLVTTDAPGLAEALPAGFAAKAAVDDAGELGRLLAGVIDDPAAARADVAAHRAELLERFAPERMAQAYGAAYAALAERR